MSGDSGMKTPQSDRAGSHRDDALSKAGSIKQIDDLSPQGKDIQDADQVKGGALGQRPPESAPRGIRPF
jgi:hypothetical protein